MFEKWRNEKKILFMYTEYLCGIEFMCVATIKHLIQKKTINGNSINISFQLKSMIINGQYHLYMSIVHGVCDILGRQLTLIARFIWPYARFTCASLNVCTQFLNDLDQGVHWVGWTVYSFIIWKKCYKFTNHIHKKANKTKFRQHRKKVKITGSR